MPTKLLAGKGYGHIPHLPGSRMGPGDHHCHEGQARICTEKARDKHDRIIVQEKLDGSCVGVAKVDGNCHPINRAGYLAISSKWEHHRMFADWAMQPEQYERFDRVLQEGERLMGEWLALAHGTRYELQHEPFVAFDILRGLERLPYDEFRNRLTGDVFVRPWCLHDGGPMPIELALHLFQQHGSAHGAIDSVEGAVWRVERRGKVDVVAKYVRPDKVDGCYLPEVSGGAPVWNWRPREEVAA